MSVQILEADSKPAFAVLPIDEYRRLFDLAEDAKDAEALHHAAKRYAPGDEKASPAEVVDRPLAGVLPIRVWREHRGLRAAMLAEMIGVTPAQISKLETGNREPCIALLKRLAAAHDVKIEALVGAGG
jgi:ribosome-binding protein aMBF1 (putative translation factor)